MAQAARCSLLYCSFAVKLFFHSSTPLSPRHSGRTQKTNMKTNTKHWASITAGILSFAGYASADSFGSEKYTYDGSGNIVGHTRANGFVRLARQAEFGGEVKEGRVYCLVVILWGREEPWPTCVVF